MADAESVEALLGLAPLEVGQRVQVRLSGECPALRHAGLPDENGAEGVVDEVLAVALWEPGHRYTVRFTPAIDLRDKRGRWLGSAVANTFARAELERLAAE